MADGDYEWFLTLAELQHVTAAAQQLHIAQPTLTRMLARLERRLGVALFDRHGRRVSLSTYGRIFYEHARRAQSELDSARREIEDLSNPAAGEIRLGFLGSFGSIVVPRLIAGFAAVSPRVTFTLEEGAAESIGDRVLVQPLEEKEVKKGGIIIPDTAKEKPQEGTVAAVGTGKLDDNGNKIEFNVKVGDKVLFSKYGGVEFKIDGENYLIMREDDILGIIG